MLTHRSIWNAIDALAVRHDLSVSGLARRAGLDPTTFNKSKRRARDGRERWPSTGSISKVLSVTGESIDQFMELAGELSGGRARTIPLIGLAQAGSGGYFDEGGLPSGGGWDAIPFPDIGANGIFALEIAGESMQPLYRDGDIVIVAPGEPVRRGDRIVVKTTGGEVMVKILSRRTATKIELRSLNGDYSDRSLPVEEVSWMARILWVSQ